MSVDVASAGLAERPSGETLTAEPSPSDRKVPAIGPEAAALEVMATTRAMRRLAPDPVPPELLRKVVEAATWAPSAANLQIVQYLVVTDRATIARLTPLWLEVHDRYRTLLEADATDLGDPAMVARMRASVEYQRAHFAETPALIVVCEDPAASRRGSRSTGRTMLELVRRVGPVRTIRLARAFQRAADRSYGASVYPAVENLLLAARAYGLGATLTTWHLFAEREFKAALGLRDDIRTFAIIPIGWPLGQFGKVNRRPVDEVLHIEHW